MAVPIFIGFPAADDGMDAEVGGSVDNLSSFSNDSI